MKNIKLNSFLLLNTAAILLITVVAMFLVYFQIKSNKNRRDAYEIFNLMHSEFINSQLAQNEFLSNYTTDNIFFQSEQNKYIKKYELSVTRLYLFLDTLSQNFYITSINLDDDLMSVKQTLSKNEEIFGNITHSLFLRGSQNTGLVGNLISQFNTIFLLLEKNPSLLSYSEYVDYFQEQLLNYLASPSLNFYNNFIDKYYELNYRLSNIMYIRDTVLVDTIRLIQTSNKDLFEFIDLCNSLKQNFGKLVSLDRNIFLNEQDNLIKNLQITNEYITDKFSDIKNILQAENNLKNRRLFQIFFIYFGALIIILVIILIYLPNYLSKRLELLQKILNPLKYGQIPEIPQSTILTNIVEFKEIHEIIGSYTESMKKATAFANDLAKGHLESDFKPISSQDTLGNALILLRENLKKANEEQERRKKEDEIRLWINTGLAKFADIFRQTSNIDELSGLVIKELVNYIGANQGGVFIVNDERKDNIYLELKASYAYSKERKKRLIFKLGESLVGTCAIEKATIYMTDIPEDYISITSGLGEATPRSLLLTPIKTEDKVLGVFEIASFVQMEKYIIEFVEKIAESFASTISIAKINQETVKLLETAKIEAEQRMQKEEELRQNLEELKATQEKLNYQQAQLTKYVSIISEVAFVVDLDMNGNFVTVPERLLVILNMNLNDVIGHNIAEFDMNVDSKLTKIEFWQELLEGRAQKLTYKVKIQDGSILWFDLYIYPWFDENGQIIKFVGIFVNITEQVRLREDFEKAYKEIEAKDRLLEAKLKELDEINQRLVIEKNNLTETNEKLKVLQQTLEKQNQKNEALIKQSEEMLKKLQKSLMSTRKILEKITDPFIFLFNNSIIFINEQCQNLFGLSEQEFKALSILNLSPDIQDDGTKSAELWAKYIDEVKESGTVEFHWAFLDKNKNKFSAQVVLSNFIVAENTYNYLLIQKK